MINEKQIDSFLKELKQLMDGGKTTGDFSDLYKKYPKVKVGIRVAMRFLKEQQ